MAVAMRSTARLVNVVLKSSVFDQRMYFSSTHLCQCTVKRQKGNKGVKKKGSQLVKNTKDLQNAADQKGMKEVADSNTWTEFARQAASICYDDKHQVAWKPKIPYLKMIADRKIAAKNMALFRTPSDKHSALQHAARYGKIKQCYYFQTVLPGKEPVGYTLVLFWNQESVVRLKKIPLKEMDLENRSHPLHPTVFTIPSAESLKKVETGDSTGGNPLLIDHELIFPRSVSKKLLKKELNFAKNLSEQMKILDKNIKVGRLEQLLDDYICHCVEQAVQTVFPDVQVEIFGSSASGLCITGKDLDLGIVLPAAESWRSQKPNVPSSDTISDQDLNWKSANPVYGAMTVVSKAVSTLLPVDEMQQIYSAKAPLLQFTFIPTGTRCDLNFKSGNSFEASELMYTLADLDPKFPVLFRTVKYLMAEFGLTGTGITNLPRSYSYTLMVVVFLQREGLLPPLNHITNESESRDVSFAGVQCNTQYCSWRSLGKLLLEFLNFYSRLNFSSHTISPDVGKILLNHCTGKNHMNITDPLNVHNCVSGNVSSSYVKLMQSLMYKMHQTLIGFPSHHSKGLEYLMHKNLKKININSNHKHSEKNSVVASSDENEMKKRIIALIKEDFLPKKSQTTCKSDIGEMTVGPVSGVHVDMVDTDPDIDSGVDSISSADQGDGILCPECSELPLNKLPMENKNSEALEPPERWANVLKILKEYQ